MGTMWVAGTIVDVGQRQEFPVKQSGGKGSGTEQYSYEAHQNFSILVCESDELKGSTISQVLMVEQDGKIVYDVRPGSTMLADSQKWLARNCIFYYGDEAQLPTAADEAAHGVGNAPAYRGVLRAFFTQFNVTAVGDRIPNFRFLVKTKTKTNVVSPQGTWKFDIADKGVWGDRNLPDYDDSAWPIYRAPFGNANQTLCNTAHQFDSRFAQAVAYPFSFGPSNDYWLRAQIHLDPAQIDNSVAGIFDLKFCTGTGSHLTVFINGTLATVVDGGTDEGVSASIQQSYFQPGMNVIAVRMWTNIDGAQLYGDIIIDSGDINDPLLSDIVSGVCARGGLEQSTIDVSALADIAVHGYAIAKQMNAVSALGPLLGAHFAYGSEYDGKIHFDFYGKDAVMTIDEDDILEANDANGNAVTANLRNNATEFPKRIIGKYYDPDQNYMPVTVMQTRRAAGVTATGDLQMDLPIVMPADQAQQTVDKALKVAYAQLEGTLEFSVPFAGKDNVYLSLVPGDAVIFRGKRWIVTNPILSAGYIKLTLQYDRQSAYTSNVQAIPGLAPTPPASRYSGPTTLIPINLPQLQTGDTYGLYLAAGPVDPTTQNWRGCNVQMSLDSGATWQTVTQINAPSTYGTVVTDTGAELDVQVDGDLESVGSAQLDARQNGAALIQGTATEVLQFGTATEDPDTAHLYALTDMRRAQLGTTQISGAAGDTFVMLDSVVLLPIDLAFAGQTIQLRGVGFGEDADSATVVSVVYNPDTSVIIDGGTPGDGLPPPGGS